MNTSLIVSGASLNKSFLKEYVTNNAFTYIIAVDKGLEVLCELNIQPTHIIRRF